MWSFIFSLSCIVKNYKYVSHDLKNIKEPMIIKGMINDWDALKKWETREKFENLYGNYKINAKRTYLGDKVDTLSIKEFGDISHIQHIIVMDDDRITREENTLLESIKKDFTVPKLFENITYSRVLSYGGGFRGVDFMKHCAAWIGMISGQKLWQFASPMYHDVVTDCENVSTDPRISSCIVNKSDVVYVPDMWWHATCNLDKYTIAIGTQCWNDRKEEYMWLHDEL